MWALRYTSRVLARVVSRPLRLSEMLTPDRCSIIGEVAQAHDGSLGMAHAFIDAVARAGADAVKFQTHIAAAESTPSRALAREFSLQDETRYEYWRRMEFTEAQWAGLAQHAAERGSPSSARPSRKRRSRCSSASGSTPGRSRPARSATRRCSIASATRRPVLVSTGMSPMAEIDAAAARLPGGRRADRRACSARSSIRARPNRVGLNLLSEFRRRYECPVGLSDHSGTIFPALAAARSARTSSKCT